MDHGGGWGNQLNHDPLGLRETSKTQEVKKMIYKVIRKIEDKKAPQMEERALMESGRERTYAYRKLGFIPYLF